MMLGCRGVMWGAGPAGETEQRPAGREARQARNLWVRMDAGQGEDEGWVINGKGTGRKRLRSEWVGAAACGATGLGREVQKGREEAEKSSKRWAREAGERTVLPLPYRAGGARSGVHGEGGPARLGHGPRGAPGPGWVRGGRAASPRAGSERPGEGSRAGAAVPGSKRKEPRRGGRGRLVLRGGREEPGGAVRGPTAAGRGASGAAPGGSRGGGALLGRTDTCLLAGTCQSRESGS